MFVFSLGAAIALGAGGVPGSLTAANNSRWLAEVWDAEALGSLNINGITQSDDGFLWIATPAALHRFDGSRFAAFEPTTFADKPGGRVATVRRSRAGGLWVAMDGGRIIRIQGAASRVILAPSQESVDDMVEDADGNLWIAYHGGIVVQVRGDTAAIVRNGGGQTDCSLALDRQGRVWLAHDGVVGTLQPSGFTRRHDFSAAPTAVCGSASGPVWVCAGPRLYRLGEDGPPIDVGLVSTAPRGIRPTAMLEDRRGVLWIGTSDIGLLRRTEAGCEPIPTSFRRINQLFEDDEGNLWVGTGGGGLNRLKENIVAIEGSVTGLPAESVQSLCEDTEGRVWAATQGGRLLVRQGPGWAAPDIASVPRGGATCVAADQQGGIWVGTRLQRVHHLVGGEFQTYGERRGIVSRTTNDLLVSRTGDVWIAGTSPAAVQRIRDETLSRFELPRLSALPVRLAEDRDGRIWVGTTDGALLRVEGDALVEQGGWSPRGMNRAVTCLFPTADGTLWVGYERNGLARVKGGQYVHFETKHGLASDDVRLLTADVHGRLWIASQRFLFSLDPSELDDVATGRRNQVQSLRYGGDRSPLLATRTESGDALQARDGRLWFPMGNALAIVAPDKPTHAPQPSAVRITEVSVDDRVWMEEARPGAKAQVTPKQVAPGGALELPATHRKLVLAFSCLSFSSPENIRFRYRLDGFDDAWTETASARSATYPRLPSGTYRFEVLGCNSAGVWTPSPAVIALAVPPLLWQRLWFQLLLLLIFTVAVTAAVRAISFRRLRRRVESLERQAAIERERSRIARDIHDDVGNRLTRILMLSQLAERDLTQPDQTAQHLRGISTSALEVTNSLDEIVWAVNPRNDTLPHLLDYLGHYAVEFLRTAGVRCIADLPKTPPPDPVATEVRHNFFLAVKEALHNVVRHAAATEVTLRVALDGHELRAEIEDNGRGIVAVGTTAGEDGLANMRERMAELGGRCDIVSTPGTGTRVIFAFPWSR